MNNYIAEKWDDLIGVDSIRKSIEANYKSLKNSSSSIQYKPIMFYGLRGCGKSSMSQIISKDFCKKENVLLQNCGDQTGVDVIRENLEFLSHSSIFGNRKVWILDEIHRLSDSAKQALLSPLEPDKITRNLIVIGCTTEPDKILKTLWDRFNQYKVRALTSNESVLLYNRICKAEGLKFNKAMKALILEKADGNPRNLIAGILKVKSVSDFSEAEYLLDVINIDADPDVLELFKLCLAYIKESDVLLWTDLYGSLNKLLKKKSPESIRVALMNIISGRMTSKWFSPSKEGLKLVRLFESLKKAEGFPEKASLLVGLYKGVN